MGELGRRMVRRALEALQSDSVARAVERGPLLDVVVAGMSASARARRVLRRVGSLLPERLGGAFLVDLAAPAPHGTDAAPARRRSR